MDHDDGKKIITITETHITEDQRQLFKSFGTRISGAIHIDGRYRGVIGCAGSSLEHEDCDFALAEMRDTSEQAMDDARTLSYLLEDGANPTQVCREVPSAFYRGFNYTTAPATGADGRYSDNFSIHGPKDGDHPHNLVTFHTTNRKEAGSFATIEDAAKSIRDRAMKWIDDKMTN